MIDLGLFVSQSYSHAAQQLAFVLGTLGQVGIAGGLVHQNKTGSQQALSDGFVPALAANQLGSAEIDVHAVRFVTYRGHVADKPAHLSALMAQCADMNALLLIHSPFAEAESASVALATRGGQRLVNFSLAKALLCFLADEAQYWGCKLHIHSVSTAAELQLLDAYRRQGGITASVPLHMLADVEDVFGYGYAGRLWPATSAAQERAQLVDALRAGLADAVTSHLHIFSELLELDPMSADPGADTRPHLLSWQKEVETTLGSNLWATLTDTNPRALLA